MYTQMSLLMGCCRERYLTRIDKNVEDENVSWTCSARPPGNVREWFNTTGNPAETLRVYPASGYFHVSQTTPDPFNGFHHSNGMAGAGYMTGPSKTSGRTSEMYFRVMVYMIRNSGECHIASVTDKDGKVIFRVNGSSIGNQNGDGFRITVDWTDTENKQQTMTASRLTTPGGSNWVDVKVFIPANGEASMSCTPALNTGYGVTTRNSLSTKGFMDNTGDRLHVFSSNGPNADWNPNYYIYRVGIGNRISTAQP